MFLAFAGAVIALAYYLISTPKRIKLQPHLEERLRFDYSTSLIVQKDSSLKELLLLRRV